MLKKKEIAIQPEEVIARIREKARKNLRNGLNCAECVFEAVISQVDTGLPHETMCVMTGFESGVGLIGDTCGALVGALAALGAVYGRREIPTSLKVAREELYGNPGIYRLFNRLPNEFKKRFGSTQCRLLTAQWRKNWCCRDHIQFCRNLITEMAGMAAEMAVPKDLARWGSAPFQERPGAEGKDQ
jgi:C_GCAxxG_C_C family probable redox protein